MGPSASDSRTRRQLIDEVRELVMQYTGISLDKVCEDSDLSDDIGLEGDGALEFIEAYAKKFSVDMVSFRFEDYFYNESQVTFPQSILLLFCKDTSKRKITVGDLVDYAERRKWQAVSAKDIRG